MAGGRRKRAASEEDNPPPPVEEETEEVVMEEEEEEEDPLKVEVGKLRARWELASVLNFMIVFEPLIGKAVKLSAEEIETGLINPDRSIAQLHIALLKGIPPVSRVLDGPDEWITVLCKKLAPWWRWVAEGEIPLVAAKGEEKSRYKELGPTKRLLLLKALCELRAEQDDAFAYINDALKEGTDVSFFRKDKIGGDGNGTSYWYEGNPIIGHRLYKEVTVLDSKAKGRGQGILNLQNIIFQWETVATNLEEFQKVVDELSSSKEEGEVAVANALQTSAIPVLEKLQKKKEKALKDKERRERLLNDWRNSYSVGTTRSCRNRRPVNYTFDEYDRAIHEAIKVTNKKKTTVEKGQESKRRRRNEIDTTGASEGTTNSEDNSGQKSDPDNSGGKKDDSTGNDTASEMVREDSHDENDDNWGDTKDGGSSEHSDQVNSETDGIAQKPLGSRWSKRLAGDTDHPITNNRNLRMKNNSRQRPMCNSALDSAVVPDSEDESSFEHEESPATDPKEVAES